MKLIKILTIVFCIVIILSTNVFALSETLSTGEAWEATGRENANTTINTDNLSEISGKLYNILLAVATAVAIIVGAILGIQYMAAGIDKKVEVKESLFPYIISCIIVFGSLGIWRLVVTIMGQI